MVTGASTSQASIILVDARNGVIEQTYRHFFINNLLRIKDIVVAVNKMDLVDYSEEKFNAIKAEFGKLIEASDYKEQNITFVPISALKGDNVVGSSENTPWYNGDSILEHLEKLDAQHIFEKGQARFPVQTVIRPKKDEFHDFRGYAGKLYGGDLSVGDEITVLPSLTKSKIKEIYFFDEKFDKAGRGSSINITLEDNINVSRGDMIVKTGEEPNVEKQLKAKVCWMDSKPLASRTKYLLQHGVNRVQAMITGIDNVLAPDFSGKDASAEALSLNQIGEVDIKLAKPVFFDQYTKNKSNGSFILIDPQTNHTAGVGFIQ